MPGLGLGVDKVDDGNLVEGTVKTAINHGYRSIDTPTLYNNKTGVGKGIARSSISRDKLFITSKVWNDDQGYESTLKAFHTSLAKLGLTYLDLYLIHWPNKDKSKDTWRAMEKLYAEGFIRAIGASNFQISDLEKLLDCANVKPVINQIEYHPHLTQRKLKTFCKERDIQLEAWSPLKRGKILDNPIIVEIAKRHHKTPAQIVLRWDIETSVMVIPKSVHEKRIIENASIFDFSLTQEDIEQINSLNRNERSNGEILIEY